VIEPIPQPIGRFRFMDAQPVNLDGIAVEDAHLGLIAFDSPHDPAPSLVLGPDGAVAEMDSRPAAELVRFASGAELFLVEATLPVPERNGDRGHSTPEEAGGQGRSAGVARLVITHISDELDQEDARRRASEAFGAPVDVASEGAVFEI